MKKYTNIIFFTLYLVLNLCNGDEQTNKISKMRLKSSAFQNEGQIPKEYTCFGKNISLPLTISGVKKDTKSILLLMVDKESSKIPDQEICWFIYNVPPETKEIFANKLPKKASLGSASNGYNKYSGPCQKNYGVHHYYISLYALDIVLPQGITTLKEASNLMDGHLIDYTKLMGTYSRF
ncbi:YbhB/YbcL family Raf kinase inhibitor-like protein [Gammaproteobacteria bacterium]|nr:YbhB/YbcL family Raf kinase inhibitor-like protein [Gammaproteobacteria bacterium]